VKTWKLFWKSLYWINWLIIGGFWVKGCIPLFSDGFSPGLVFMSLGMLCGLGGGYMILLQFLFVGRMPWLEQTFGLDQLTRLHKDNGKRGIVFIILHVILITFGYALITHQGVIAQFFDLLKNYEDVFNALLGFVLFLIVVGVSLSIVRLRLKYESWYFVHLFVYAAMAFSFGHQFSIGSDLLASKFFYGYWAALYILIFGNHLYFRFIRPIYRFHIHRFIVEQIKRETDQAVSLIIGGKNLRDFPIKAGQFMLLRFFTKGRWWQSHPFSMSMMPDGNHLRVTVKELGDFTNDVKDIPIGTKVFIDGPYGVFTSANSSRNKILMIAGGIGITPIRSLVEDLAEQKKDIVLLYGNRSEKDIAFAEELTRLADAHKSFKMVNILSDQPDFLGEKGIIDVEKIKRLVPDLLEREIFLCGPVLMMDAIVSTLRSLGVSEELIHYEKFALV
jgi:predicted ferric reductase